MIARKNRSRGCNLLITLFDELFENARTSAETGLNLRKRVPAIGLANEKVSCTL
jgi:hypothetical protein